MTTERSNRPDTPPVASDVVIHLEGGSRREIVLIERRYAPPGWALPGGFVEFGETVEQAAAREAKEETGLTVRIEGLLGVYSDPDRDPRGQVVSVIYYGTGWGEPVGGDDAARAKLFPIDELPAFMAFDHARIVKDYGRFLETI
jgi:8-oxo-dGTP diphosphatase